MLYLIIFVAGLLIGAGLLLLIAYERAPKWMIFENQVRFDFAGAEEEFIRLVAEKGWKIPSSHDLQATMYKNGFQVLPVKVFDICKPALANEILSRDEERLVSNLMPCRLALYQRSDGRVYISRLNSGLVARPMPGVVPKVMKLAAAEMEEIIKMMC